MAWAERPYKNYFDQYLFIIIRLMVRKMSIRRARLFIRGFVQGVGFRPFIFNLARSKGLRGYVSNLGDAGVEIVAEGEEAALDSFIREIPLKKPPVSRIDEIELNWEVPRNESGDFSISKSQESKLSVRSVIPVDLGICDCCITEMKSQTRFRCYPFTSCAHCGPRFTMIRKLPYDRVNTAMASFPFCPDCERDYLDPGSRRYDVQGFACPRCGPRLTLLDSQGNDMQLEDPIKEAARLLLEGSIIAVKGVGGFHLSVDATNESAVTELRRRRRRPNQPFAVMSSSIDQIRKYACVGDAEEKLLTDQARPILVLKKSKNYCLAESVSPGLDTVGVMLPYTGLHLLLLEYFKKEALVMTSANFPGKPITVDETEVRKELMGVVDFYLVHNREIINRCDDSVIKVLDGNPVFLRKSRGYSPSYLKPSWSVKNHQILALGGELNNNASLFVQDRIITTQHIGDVDDLETLDYMMNTIRFIQNVYDIKNPDLIVSDMHPAFLTTRRAKELSAELECDLAQVQHHHAHAAALMAENSFGVGSKIISIVIDGAGYGLDGNVWGGEIFLAGYSGFERLASLEYHPMPGGDLCTYYPARMLAAILSSFMSESEIEQYFEKNTSKYFKHGLDELHYVLKQSKESSTIKTSSLGRLLDALAVVLDICWLRTYEGEPPMRLEALASLGNPASVNLELKCRKINGKYVFDTSNFLCSILEHMSYNSCKDVALAIHKSIGTAFGELSCALADEFGCKEIGLSGGAAVNSILNFYIKDVISKNNKTFITHKKYPCGDGCISLGQAVVASTKFCDIHHESQI
ncbi:MAG: carbamoyltransferase HypF [Candidatus Verstraetearchaeota archaeon]|nr:carbamoyltransferase HypF [Candidatus Verstraetearchaeota archaeon]